MQRSPTGEEPSSATRLSTLDQLLQNFWAGVGLSILLLILSIGNNGEGHDFAPLLGGAGLFGLLCIIRFSRDEVHILVQTVIAGMAITTARRLIRQQQQEIERLEIEIRLLRGKLDRNTLGVDHTLEREVDDHEHYAIVLYNRIVNELPISRSEIERLKLMTRSQWSQGRKFLIAAGVTDARGAPLIGSQEEGLQSIREYATKLRKEAR